MRLTVLMDNNTYIDRYFLGEPAVSYYIEEGEERLLLDAGYSDAFLKNALAMGLDLGTVGTVVLSHGHNDHTRGLPYLLRQAAGQVKLVAHPDVLLPKQFGGEDIGAPPLETDKVTFQLTREPLHLGDRITFLGEIPQMVEFEPRSPIGKRYKNGEWEADLVEEDSALVFKGKAGLFLITGCSHSGVCSQIEYAKQVTGERRVQGLIGGFHLFEGDDRAKATAEYLKKNVQGPIYPCHCTAFAVRALLSRCLPVTEVGVGLSIELK